MAAAIYCRVSTEEQRERQSILTQTEFAERYWKLHAFAVYRLYADDGVSGTVPLEKRAEGDQVLTDARLGKFDQLLIYKLDRLGRDTRLILNAVAELEKLGVRVRSMTEEFDTASATGRLMLTMLSGFATHEREVIRERSVAGTRRVAGTGVWLGGIVPYGYRKEGDKRNARLVISNDEIPDIGMSEVDVIREVFRLSTVENKSCRVIAALLNQLRIPCAYVRDDRLLLRGKRRERTRGFWRAGRVRGLIMNTSYMGVHEWGKRTKSTRPLVSRVVPAIVSAEIWKKAQANLKAHMLFSLRGAKNKYLLRGLIKCDLCNHTYIGLAANRSNGKREFYYKCNGAHTASLLAWPEQRCMSKAIRGDHLEKQVWSDVEAFLRNPGPILEQLHAKLEGESKGSDKTQAQITRLEGLLSQKETERSRVVGLFRRGRLDEAGLDKQMDEMNKEEAALQTQLEQLRGKIVTAHSVNTSITTAKALLAKLRKQLDGPISWEIKRQLVETLVAGIRVETVESFGVKQAKITVTYRFSEPDKAFPVMLPHSYSEMRTVRMPATLVTIGDHSRRKRLVSKLLQREVADLIGTTKETVYNWESDGKQPEIRFMPAIIEFLGYNPLPPATSLAERLVRHRTSLGLSQKQTAERLGIDPSTLGRWECGEREPTDGLAERVTRMLAAVERAPAKLNRAG